MLKPDNHNKAEMKLLLVSFLLLFVNGYAFAEEVEKTSEEGYIINPEDEPFYNVLFGVSPFFGILGIEVLRGSHSVGFGFPVRLFYRYYNKPYADSLFYGLYAGRSKQPDNIEKKLDGVIYEDAETTDAGFGVGYRWQWSSGWNVTTSFSIHYMDEEYSNPGQPKKKDTSVIPFPGINAGYKF